MLDSGSEIPCINEEKAKWMKNQEYTIEDDRHQIHLADKSTTTSEGSVHLECRIGNEKYKHSFRILPTLESAAFIGTDLCGKMGISISPPLIFTQEKQIKIATTSGRLSIKTPYEEAKLKTFLNKEIPKFEKINGPTPYVTHKIDRKRERSLLNKDTNHKIPQCKT